GRHWRGGGQQHLPLHRLRQNHRGGEVRRRAPRRRSFAVTSAARTHECAAPSPLPPPQAGEGVERAWSFAVSEVVAAHNIGGYVPMVDGPDKVSGRAKYTADLVAPGLLAGRLFRSPYSPPQALDVALPPAPR